MPALFSPSWNRYNIIPSEARLHAHKGEYILKAKIAFASTPDTTDSTEQIIWMRLEASSQTFINTPLFDNEPCGNIDRETLIRPPGGAVCLMLNRNTVNHQARTNNRASLTIRVEAAMVATFSDGTQSADRLRLIFITDTDWRQHAVLPDDPSIPTPPPPTPPTSKRGRSPGVSLPVPEPT